MGVSIFQRCVDYAANLFETFLWSSDGGGSEVDNPENAAKLGVLMKLVFIQELSAEVQFSSGSIPKSTC
ncbi:hypothetical protein E7811_17310 [Aliigemmobacter aestuarii]|uniref:Uncharacterized protein n=1 Tax=Aliigemmobacter aestuarii TaxID=1445661 RepID=A0A4S3MK12_9RHOB|nr:hypothetical protein E7811_17310 [Gemmobacter aestuarii]